MNFNRDTYSYMWPRDGALVAYAYDLAGYGETVGFYNFCAARIAGKPRATYCCTSTRHRVRSPAPWHPWQKEGTPAAPAYPGG